MQPAGLAAAAAAPEAAPEAVLAAVPAAALAAGLAAGRGEMMKAHDCMMAQLIRRLYRRLAWRLYRRLAWRLCWRLAWRLDERLRWRLDGRMSGRLDEWAAGRNRRTNEGRRKMTLVKEIFEIIKKLVEKFIKGVKGEKVMKWLNVIFSVISGVFRLISKLYVKIAPCDFCGGYAAQLEKRPNGWIVFCPSCLACTIGAYRTRRRAKIAWRDQNGSAN